jgi:hypothetical protein
MTEFNNYIVKMSKLVSKVHKNVKLVQNQKLYEVQNVKRNKNRKTCQNFVVES